MKLPKKPPQTNLLELAKRSPQRLAHLLMSAVPDKYYHWDKLRHLKPPEGLALEEWWSAIKFKRLSGYRRLPLLGTDAQPFQFTVPDSVLESLHRIDLGAGGHIGFPDQITNRQTRDQYYIKSLIQEAITSSQLEGAVTTREVAKEMIRIGRPPRDRSERMILNNYLTMRHLHSIRGCELTPALIFDIHRLVTEGTLDSEGGEGRFRRPDEDIRVHDDEDDQTLHVPPAAEELPKRMELLCAFVNDAGSKPFMHPALRAIIAHFWLAYDHPFVDGNGRTARALFYWCMLRYDFWLFEFISISSILRQAPKSYARSFLYSETDDNDLTYFILHQIEVIERAVKALHDYIERKSRELRDTQAHIQSLQSFNHRQQALLNHALNHPYQEYTTESHRRSHDITYQTSRADLLELAELELLIKRKQGRKFAFHPPKDIAERLKALRPAE